MRISDWSSDVCSSDLDLSKFRILFLAGERCDPDTLIWAQDRLQVPVIDHWWQTETGWSIAANCMGIEPLTVKPGSPTKAVPGWDLQDRKSVVEGSSGSVRVVLGGGRIIKKKQK